MGRTLKRVPLDFVYPINKIWSGYLPTIKTMKSLFPELVKCNDISEICRNCKIKDECSEDAPECVWHYEANKKKWFKEVPEGEGYQLWENTTEGSPQSPVFATLDELCEWCEKNATTFADSKATKEQWFQMLTDDLVYHQEGNFMFI